MSIETLNQWARQIQETGVSLFWQSSLLISIVWIVEFALRRKLRAAVRYGLWMVVLIKLVTPPSLALPTGVGWWLSEPQASSGLNTFTVMQSQDANTESATPNTSPTTPVQPTTISETVWALAGWGVISLALLCWLALRWRQVARDVRNSDLAPAALDTILEEARQLCGLRHKVQLRLTDRPMSPAVCGLVHRCILVPGVLAQKLSPEQMRAVLLHELIHIRRGDVWVNFAQALLQILYWWHPLVWISNARIRRVREEAVDDAVIISLASGSDTYAPTLLEVAKLAFSRPLATMGLIGILESRSALKQRIERLLVLKTPRKAGLTLASILGIAAFTALAVPMGEAPILKPQAEPPAHPPAQESSNIQAPLPATNSALPRIRVESKFIELRNFDPASEPAGSPLRALPLNGLTNASAAQTPAAADIRDKFEQPERLRLITDANPIVAKTLSHEDVRLLLKRLEERSGTDVLSPPPVTTGDGLQVHVAHNEIKTVVTGVIAGLEGTPATAHATYLTEKFPVGVVLDVQPRLKNDDHTITLDVKGRLLEFIGYDKPTKAEEIEVTVPGAMPLKVDPPFPRFCLREWTTKRSVNNNQTLLLAGPVAYETVVMKDKVAGLGDIPLLGRLFRKERTTQIKKHLIVLITPILIDGASQALDAGNP